MRDGTWPDLRMVDRRTGFDVPAPASPGWCHGAPGIALSRLRAAALLDSEAVRDDARIALALTRGHAGECIEVAPDDFSLCHGAAGVADVLLYAADRSGLAERIAALGIERHHDRRPGFPGGLAGGETPGLMVGLSGIGHFYLRLADRTVQSALVISPESAPRFAKRS